MTHHGWEYTLEGMLYRLTLLAAIVLVFAASLSARRRIDNTMRPTTTPWWQCQRIVAMAPSIAETLYPLGLGDRVVGVTRDCRYPPEVVELRKTHGDVGGYFAPNYEAILALEPDLVILLKEQAAWQAVLERLGLETLVVNHQTTDGIVDSFETIGRVCGQSGEGSWMKRDFQDRIQRLREKTRHLDRPKVLFVVDRTIGDGKITSIQVAGDDDYIDTLIDWAGGCNAYTKRGVRYPVVSVEGIMQLNPDIIVDLVWPDKLREVGREKFLDDWNSLKNITAVRNGRVYIPEGDFATVPGPRFLDLAEYLAQAIHSEVDWEQPEAVDFPVGPWYDRQ